MHLYPSNFFTEQATPSSATAAAAASLDSGTLTSLADGALFLAPAAATMQHYDLGNALRLLHPKSVSPLGSAFLKQLSVQAATVSDVIEAIVRRHLSSAAGTLPPPPAEVVWDQLKFVRDHVTQCKNASTLPTALLIPGKNLCTFLRYASL